MKKVVVTLVLCHFLINVYAQPIESVVQRSGAGKCIDFTISSDGLFLAKVTNPSTNTSNLKTWKQKLTVINDPINTYASEIEIWNTKTGHLLRVINANQTNGRSVMKVRFWKGSKSIIVSKQGGIHEVYDVSTGKFLTYLPLLKYPDVDGVFAINEKSGVFAFIPPYSVGSDQLVFFDLFSNTQYDSVRFNFNNITALEFSPDAKEIAIGTKDGSVHIIELLTFNRKVKLSSEYPDKINYLQWTNDNYLLVSKNDSWMLWNIKKQKTDNYGIMKPGARILTSPTEDFLYQATDSSLLRLDAQSKIQKQLGISPDYIQKISFDANNERMYVLTDNFIKLWDMKNISQIASITTKKMLPETFSRMTSLEKIENFHFVPGIRSAMFTDNNQIIVHPIDTNYSAKNYVFSKDSIESFVIWNNHPAITLNNTLVSWKKTIPSEIAIDSHEKILFTFQSNQIATAGTPDSILKIRDLETGKLQQLIFPRSIDCGALSSSESHFAVAGDELFLVDTKTLKYKKLSDPAKENYTIGGMSAEKKTQSYVQVCFSKDGQKLFTNNAYGHVKVWNLKTFRIDTILNIGANFLYTSEKDNRIYIAANNEILWINTITLHTEARIVFLEKGDYIVSLPDNYYKTSRNGAKAIAFRKGLYTSGFDQFDVVYNRPDIVTTKLGAPSVEVKEMLQKLVAKRYKKLGVSTAKTNEIDAPELEIQDFSSLPTFTDKQLLQFIVTLKDNKNLLVDCKAFINGVPFSSKNGVKLSDISNDLAIHEKSIRLSVKLNKGRNLIEVICSNNKGIESNKASFEIFYEGNTDHKPDLYFIGIGAGTYKSEEFNLKYPPKDVKEVAAIYATKKDMFANIHTVLLTNEQVTKANILNIKKLINSSGIEDHVIVYWSGHGILNNDLDYYLATYDIDFNNPTLTGMPYSELENLLDDIPARKRLLFIDACHSGELDKEETNWVSNAKSEEGKVTIYTNKSTIKKTKAITASTLFNELFADVRRHSGANIISASGGAEFALEADTWSHGVFTFCLLKALSEKQADLNNDGYVSVSELQTYLQQKVPQLTNGQQKPTSRTENLVNDWRIW